MTFLQQIQEALIYLRNLKSTSAAFTFYYQSMEEIRKIAKNQAWFRPIVERAKISYKAAHKELTDFDENKLTREQFRGVSNPP
jgi:hypothetical protein